MARRAQFWIGTTALVLGAVVLWMWVRGGEGPVGSPGGSSTVVAGAESRPVEPSPPPEDAPHPASTGPADIAEGAPLGHARESARNLRVAGRVIDAAGAPLAGVRVRAAPMVQGGRNGEEEIRTAFTDGEGKFRFDGLGADPLILVARADGRRGEIVRDVRPGAENFEIVLDAQTGVAGRVLDAETGAAVHRFRVRALGMPGSRFRPPLSFEADDGAFAISDLGEGQWKLTVDAADYLPTTSEPLALEESGMRGGLEIRLHRALAVRGTVVDGDSGAPVAGATVRHFLPDNPYAWAESARTDSNGAFAVDGASPGTRLHVRHADYADATTEPVGTAGEWTVSGVVIRLARGGGVEGHAFREDGSPLAGGSAMASPLNPPPHEFTDFLKESRADSSGHFQILGLAPGVYEVEISPPRASGEDEGLRARHTLRADAIVEAGKVTRVEFAPRGAAGCMVRGRVLRGGEAGVPGALVYVFSDGTSKPSSAQGIVRPLRDTTAKDGSYEIRNVPPGEATIQVAKGDSGVTEVGSWRIRVPEMGELVFDARLAGAEIRGRVVRASDHGPLARIYVGVRREEPSPLSTVAGIGAFTDEDGSFRVLGLDPGTYRVWAEYFVLGEEDPLFESLAPQVRGPIRLEANDIVTIDFALETGGVARVKVIGPAGELLPGEQVLMIPTPGEGAIGSKKQVLTDGTGVAHVKGLAPGRYYALLHRPEELSLRSEARVVRAGEETEFLLEVKESGQVRVWLRVLGPGDALIEGARVVFRRGDRAGEWKAAPVPGEEGVWITFLPPGEYTVDVWSEGFTPKSATILVSPKSPVEISVRLEREPAPR